ncbi:MAG: ABC transporter permease, partial [Acidimicrobiia bacterium]
LFAIVVGAAGLVVAGQALSRQLLALRADRPALAAMGLDRRQLRRAAVLRAALLVSAGSVLALVVAVALSPLFPLGVAERAEIDPGVDVDLVVLLPGIGLFAGTLLLWCAVRARAIAGSPGTTRATGRTGRGERLATSLSNPIASTGLRAAIAGGATRRTGSAGAALGGLSLAVAAVAATVTFGANIDRLVSTPNEYGWSWDAMVTLPSEQWHTPGEEIVRRFDARPEITGWSVMTLDQTTLDGERIPAVGIESGRGDVGLEIIDGRSPAGDDEVALGGRTMELLDVGIGDQVRAGQRSLEVVGQAVFPGVGTYPGADRTELGKGALLTRSAIEDVGEGFGFENLIVDAADEAGLTAALDAVLADQQAALENEEIEVHSEPALPADVLSLREVRSTPLVIAGVLALLGGAAFAVVLVSGVRARRREIAVLKTFGFRSRDVAGTVAWQATVTAVLAAVVGISLGTVLGRSAWSVLADVLGVAGDARVPGTLLAVFAGVLVAANLLAVGPGVVAARTRPATMLRAE